MMQRWREKLKYIEAGLIVTSLIMFVVSLFVDYENTGLEAAILIIGTAVISVIAEKINKKEIEKMKCQEEEELKDIVYRSKDVNISMLLEPLNGLLKKADDDTDLADMLLHMKKQQSGLYAHTINVALFGQLLARWSGCAEAEMEEVMAAGLLHDIGFLELWKDGQEQTEFLQEYETERYEKHVVSGYNLIKKMNIDQRIKQAVLTHHERVNGSGFPLQVMGDNINWISRILAVADTYDALTMRQGDKAGISAFEAIKKMEDEGYNRLDANYLMTFLKRIAETMIQRNVILNDGRMGRVVMINKYKLSCPLVQVGDTFVDLAKQSRYYIQEILEE